MSNFNANCKNAARGNNKSFSQKVIREIKRSYVGWIFALPLVIGLLVFTFYPMIRSFVDSFFDYNGVEKYDFIGFGNYAEIFTHDRDFPVIIKNTFLYAIISVPITLVLSYMIALLVNKKLKGIGVYRVLFYLPVVIPGVVAGLLWKNVFDPTYGLANTFLEMLGFEKSKFFEAAKSAMPTLIFMGIWGVGGSMILWLSALKDIPSSVYEAADLDGANALVKLFKITVPMSTSMIFYNLITGIIGSLQCFSTYIIANNGGRGPDDSLFFYAVKIYNEAFGGTKMRYGYASALAWVLFVIIGVLTALIFKTSKWVYYGEEG